MKFEINTTEKIIRVQEEKFNSTSPKALSEEIEKAIEEAYEYPIQVLQPDIIPLSERVLKRKTSDVDHGRDTIIVCGGGTSLKKHRKKFPHKAVKISVNQWAMELGVKCEYVVFCDSPGKTDDLREGLEKNPRAQRISVIPRYSDYNLDFKMGQNEYQFAAKWSTAMALWFACQVTKGDVIVAGMDLYQEKELYCVPSDSKPSNAKFTLEEQYKAWAWILQNVDDPQRVYTMPGKLEKILPVWK